MSGYRASATLRTEMGTKAQPMPELLARAKEVFGDSEIAREWWSEPNPALGWETPERCALKLGRAQEVEDILGRIVHGVLS